MSSPFANPAPPSEGITWEELKGSLLLIDVLGVEEDIKTSYGVSDAVRANVVVLDGTQKGEEYPNTLIFPKVLISQTRTMVGQKVLGRLSQTQTSSGHTAWILNEATEQDQQVGMSYLNSKSTSQPAQQQQKQNDTVPF